jgi:hypothetical protein
MRVDPIDGCCRTCGGSLQIIAADDCTMDVICTFCNDNYTVEVDAFGDGGMTYLLDFLAEQEEARHDE